MSTADDLLAVSERTIRFYDVYAESYASWREARNEGQALQEFVRLLVPGANVLDVGCGCGDDLLYLTRQGFKVDGIDGSKALLDITQRRLDALQNAPEKGTLRAQNLLFFSAPKSSYDGIWSHQTLPHFPSSAWLRLLGVFFGTLRSGGTLFLSMEEGDGFSDLNASEAGLTEALPSGERLTRRVHRFRPDDVASLIRQSGFQILLHGKTQDEVPLHGFFAKRI